MTYLIKLAFIFISFNTIFAPPVRKTQDKFDIFNDLHYKSYLEQVIKELESDEKFSEEIKSAQEHNRTDHIAQSLSFVSHKIRNKLDEIKRREIERLNLLENELLRRKHQLEGKKVPPPNANFVKVLLSDKEHLDHSNPHSFETSDLLKLINKLEIDLKLLDKKQEQVYTEHEMKKDYLRKKKLDSISDKKEREEMSIKFDESIERHNKHAKLHQPGSEEQLKEIWEKDDHLDPNDFDPKAFFTMHDINADGWLDINEIEALMQNELSKVYESNNTDDDIQERYHEMMRMRQEMMKRIDKNGDNLISKEEFLQYSSSANFKNDSEWKTQEELGKKPYTDEEFKMFSNDFDSQDMFEDIFSDQNEDLRHLSKEVLTPKPPMTPSINADQPPPAPPLL